VSFRASVLGGKANDSGDPDGIEMSELYDFDAKRKGGKNALKSASKGSVHQRDNGSNKQMDLKNLNKMQHYIIDDDNSDEEEQNSESKPDVELVPNK